MPDRSAAWQLLCQYTKGDSLRKHALAVEAAMRACAGRYGEPDADEDEWGLVGLLHDFDYEMFPSPDQHPFTGANILCGRGFSDRIIRAMNRPSQSCRWGQIWSVPPVVVSSSGWGKGCN